MNALKSLLARVIGKPTEMVLPPDDYKPIIWDESKNEYIDTEKLIDESASKPASSQPPAFQTNVNYRLVRGPRRYAEFN